MDDTTHEPTLPAAGAAERRAQPVRRHARRATLGTTAVAVVAAIGVLQFYPQSERSLVNRPFAPVAVAAAAEAPLLPFATAAVEAFGRSGSVAMRFALPEAEVELPLEVRGDRAAYTYQWVRAVDSVARGAVRPLAQAADRLVAPAEPGFYRLALVRGDGRRTLVDGVTVSVLVPFAEKKGGVLKGFKLGTWAAERGSARAKAGLPEGFVAVDSAALALPVSRHLKLGDVLRTPDTPRLGVPDYAAVDARLVEKLELVVAEVARLASADRGTAVEPKISVNSGFRPPAYNAGVKGAASNSRHQYGDAADVRIDVDRDGRFTLAELRLVKRAVESVERKHPDLAGGMGIYTGKHLRQPYVHIDARGRRARWNG